MQTPGFGAYIPRQLRSSVDAHTYDVARFPFAFLHNLLQNASIDCRQSAYEVHCNIVSKSSPSSGEEEEEEEERLVSDHILLYVRGTYVGIDRSTTVV